MPYYAILARKRWGEQCTPLSQVNGSVNKAITIAQEIYRKCGLDRALVIDESFSVVFKIDRRCKCRNCQWHIDGKLHCVDCSRIINTAKLQVEALQ